MTWGSKKVVVGIRAGGLSLYLWPEQKKLNADYPEGTVDDLEIKNEEELENWWRDVVKQLKLEGREGAVILDDTAYFKKEVDDNTGAEEFFTKVPVEIKEGEKRILDINGKKVAIALNRKLYEYLLKNDQIKKWRMVEVDVCLPGGMRLADIKIEELIQKTWSVVPQGCDLTGLAPVEDKKTGSNKKWLWIGAGLVLLVMVGVGGYLFLNKPQQKSDEPKVVEPTVVPTATVVPTQALELNTEEMKLMILNSSGVTGAAGRLRNLFLESGFAQVETGNTGNIKEGLTTIRVKPEFMNKVKELLSVIEGTYRVASPEADETLSGYDVVIEIEQGK